MDKNESKGRPNKSSRKTVEDIHVLSSNMWSELRVFLAVSRFGSFAKAGESLGLSIPTVSRSVRRLQDMLGVQLVIPGIKGAILTSEGMALQSSLASIDLSIHSIETGFRQNTGRLSGIAKVGVMEGLGGIFIAPQLHHFHSRFPGITISLKSDTSTESTLDHSCDIVLALDKFERPDITVVPLGHLHLIPAVSQSYVTENGLPTRDNLQKHTCLKYISRHGLSQSSSIWNDWKELIAPCQSGGEFESRLAYAMACISGSGIALIGNYSLSNHSLVGLDLGIDIRIPIYLTALTERLEARHIRVTAEWLIRLFNSNPQWFGDGDAAP